MPLPAWAPAGWVAADLFASVTAGLVASTFYHLYRRTGRRALLLTTAGFLLLAAAIATTRVALDGSASRLDASRAAIQTGAVLALLAAYLGVRPGPYARAFCDVGWVVVALAAGGALALAVVDPRLPQGLVQEFVLLAQGLQLLGWIALAALSARTWIDSPSALHALVPIAFLTYALSRWTWMEFHLSGERDIVPFIYLLRSVALVLLAVAMLWPLSWSARLVTPRASDDDS